MAEDQAMELPRRGVFEWNLNTVVTMGGVVMSIAATGIAWGVLKTTLENNDATLKGEIVRINNRFVSDETIRKERIADFQSQLREMRQQITVIPALNFQIEQAKEAIIESRKRVDTIEDKIDRVTENLDAKLDTAIETINKIATRVEVMGSKLDDLKKTSNDGARFSTPIIRPKF